MHSALATACRALHAARSPRLVGAWGHNSPREQARPRAGSRNRPASGDSLAPLEPQQCNKQAFPGFAAGAIRNREAQRGACGLPARRYGDREKLRANGVISPDLVSIGVYSQPPAALVIGGYTFKMLISRREFWWAHKDSNLGPAD
jgi:hypothetical protein